MKKILIASALFAMTALGSTAFADTTNIAGAGAEASSGSSAGASSNNSMSSNSRSVGLAGMAGGNCSEGFTLGAAGTGVGLNTLNKACVAAAQIDSAVQAKLITRAEGRAFWLATMESLGYKLVVPAK